MKDHINIINNKIEALRVELKVIDYTSFANNLEMSKHDKRRILELKSKIQVLNELLFNLGNIQEV